MSNFMRQQLARPSPLHSLFLVQPLLRPPFRHWRDPDGVVHWTGGFKQEIMGMEPPFARVVIVRMRFCDDQEVIGDADPGNASATCMRCLTYERERMSVIIEDDNGDTANSRDLTATPSSTESVEVAPGLYVQAYKSEDGRWIVQIDGHPPDDEDCDNVHVYLNDGYASEWIGPGEPGYGGK